MVAFAFPIRVNVPVPKMGTMFGLEVTARISSTPSWIFEISIVNVWIVLSMSKTAAPSVSETGPFPVTNDVVKSRPVAALSSASRSTTGASLILSTVMLTLALAVPPFPSSMI